MVILNLGTLMILIYRISSLLRDIKELRNTEIIESKLLHSQNLSVQESHKLMEYLVSTYFAEWRIYNVDPDSENYMTEASQKNAMN